MLGKAMEEVRVRGRGRGFGTDQGSGVLPKAAVVRVLLSAWGVGVYSQLASPLTLRATGGGVAWQRSITLIQPKF